MNQSGTIVFAAGESGSYSLFKLDLSSSELLKITHDKASYDYPRWSPGGTKILCVRRDDFSAPQIWVMDEDGSNGRALSPKGTFYHEPNWHPFEDSIIFSANIDDKNDFDLYSMKLEEDAKPVRVTSLKGTEKGPELSPDGKYLVFSAETEGNDDLWRIDLETEKWTQLTTHKADDYSPRYSKDGNQIAFISHRHKDDSDIFIMNSDGSDIKLLTENKCADKQLCWSPCGKFIIYVGSSAPESSEGRLRILSINDRTEKEISYDRNKITNSIGANWETKFKIPGIKHLAQFLGTSLVPKSFFGTERNPDWKA